MARTTIYRHWPDAQSLLLGTIDDLAAPHFPTASSGDLRADLQSTISSLVVRLTTRETRLVFSALASHAHHSETFAAAQQKFIARLTDPIKDVIEAAVERGELAADCDCQLEATILGAPVLHQHLMRYEDISDELVGTTIATWLAGRNLS